jgi:SNF2 family DNA or RNA helicase
MQERLDKLQAQLNDPATTDDEVRDTLKKRIHGTKTAIMQTPKGWLTGVKNMEEFNERFHVLTFRCKAEDVLDLPPVMHEDRTFDLGPAAMKAYRQLEDDLIADIGSGVCTAANCMVRSLRLQQCTSGFLEEDDTGVFHRLDKGKQELLTELLEDAGGAPFVVFCRFSPDVAAVQEVAEKLGLRYGELSGHRKDGLTDKGTMNPDIDVIGVQIQSGGVGIDLTRARYGAYYSMSRSLVEFEQSVKRQHRPGQTMPTTFYHLVARGTVDVKIYKALRVGQEVMDAVYEGYRKK